MKTIIWQNHTPAIENKVRTGELDIGFGGYLNGKEDMEFFPLMNQEIVVITPKEHELKDEEAISLKELGKFPVIGYDRASWMGKHTRHLYKEYQVEPNVIVECPDEYSMVAMVRENFGIALMPRTDILERAEGINIHKLENLTMQEADIFCDATGVGMHPLEELSNIPDASYFKKNLIVTDTVYAPRETVMMKQAKEAGCTRVYNGMSMMLFQALIAIELYTGKSTPVDYMKEKLGI